MLSAMYIYIRICAYGGLAEAYSYCLKLVKQVYIQTCGD